MTPSLESLLANSSEDVRALNAHILNDDTGGVSGDGKAKKRANKYGARKATFDGETFDSAKEARRWQELLFLQSAGEVAHVRRQVQYTLQEAFVDGNGDKQRAITYTADFVYEIVSETGTQTCIEDVKSAVTARSEAFRARWRLLLNRFKDDPATICRIHT